MHRLAFFLFLSLVPGVRAENGPSWGGPQVRDPRDYSFSSSI